MWPELAGILSPKDKTGGGFLPSVQYERRKRVTMMSSTVSHTAGQFRGKGGFHSADQDDPRRLGALPVTGFRRQGVRAAVRRQLWKPVRFSKALTSGSRQRNATRFVLRGFVGTPWGPERRNRSPVGRDGHNRTVLLSSRRWNVAHLPGRRDAANDERIRLGRQLTTVRERVPGKGNQLSTHGAAMTRAEDAQFHAADADKPNWAETNYFGFYSAEANICSARISGSSTRRSVSTRGAR